MGKAIKHQFFQIHGFVLFLVAIMVVNGMLAIIIERHQKPQPSLSKSTYHTNNDVSIIFGNFIIFRTSAWRAFQNFCISQIVISFVVYFPQSVSRFWNKNGLLISRDFLGARILLHKRWYFPYEKNSLVSNRLQFDWLIDPNFCSPFANRTIWSTSSPLKQTFHKMLLH